MHLWNAPSATVSDDLWEVALFFWTIYDAFFFLGSATVNSKGWTGTSTGPAFFLLLQLLHAGTTLLAVCSPP